MKKIGFCILFAIFSNLATNAQNLNPKDSITLKDVSYGKSEEQLIDVFLPADRNSKTKAFVLLHGGGWQKGSKSSMNYMVRNLKIEFPNYAIVNVNYRLGAPESPAFPKQIDDITAVFDHLKLNESNYKISKNFALIGSSAGSHLALLYAYGFDKNSNIKAICDIVGPVDFTDPSYTLNPKFDASQFKNLVGEEVTYAKNPEIYLKVSPSQYVSKKSPKTIMFYGENDPLVPKTQGFILKEKLDKNKVYNELYIYPSERHGLWSKETSKATNKEIKVKINDFFRKNF